MIIRSRVGLLLVFACALAACTGESAPDPDEQVALSEAELAEELADAGSAAGPSIDMEPRSAPRTLPHPHTPPRSREPLRHPMISADIGADRLSNAMWISRSCGVWRSGQLRREDAFVVYMALSASRSRFSAG